MSDEYIKLIRDSLRSKSHGIISRGNQPKESGDDDVNLLTKHVEARFIGLTSHCTTIHHKASTISLEQSTLLKSRTYNKLNDWLRTGAGRAAPIRSLDLQVKAGSQIISPPYDREWSLGVADAFGAKADGKFLTLQPKPYDISAAGVGFILQSSTRLMAEITPQGNYQFSVISFENHHPDYSSLGGLGVTVVQTSNNLTTFSNNIALWSDSNFTPFSGINGNGLLSDTANIGLFGPFGSDRLTPFTIILEPGENYLIWIWAWQWTNVPDNSSFLAMLNVSIPFISILAGIPPMTK
ncbi:hypothetical protein [Methylomonas sp. AM2-LC]|uniref:hypothetical protein n=1 Tax=Methylomonas sp. AM2-LC TaxID=3153301 RepID=UPI00326725CB